MNSLPWQESCVIEWSQRLLDSYTHWTREVLIDRKGNPAHEAYALFDASFVVVSHGMEQDPILNYGNQVALDLWELPWERFIKTPSRLTAEPDNRVARRYMLEQAKTQGYFYGYQGVRVSSTGRRFLVQDAFIWNVIGRDGQQVGQAATFSQWSLLPCGQDQRT